MGIPINEQETTINFQRDGETAMIWTSDNTMITRLDKLCKASGRYKLIEESKAQGVIVAKKYETDKKLISFRTDRVKRHLSENQKKELSERARKNFHSVDK